MGSINDAPSWADQWGGGDSGGHVDDRRAGDKSKDSGKGGQKMAKAKAVASAGLDKAKVAATVGAQKVKSGAGVGIKWVKAQYQKRTSK